MTIFYKIGAFLAGILAVFTFGWYKGRDKWKAKAEKAEAKAEITKINNDLIKEGIEESYEYLETKSQEVKEDVKKDNYTPELDTKLNDWD